MGYAPSLVALATVKAELGITSSTDDAYLTQLIAAASDAIAGRCNRNFTYSAAVVEALPGYASTRLLATRTPLISVASITFNSATIDSSVYSVEDASKGWIYNKNGWYWTASLIPNIACDPYPGQENRLYVVTYAGGYVTPQQAIDNVLLTRTLPYDLEDAAMQAIVSRYRDRGVNKRLTSERLLSYNYTYKDLEEISAVEDVIRRYRRVGTSR